MPLSLKASAVDIEQEEGVLYVMFSNFSGSSPEYVMLQKPIEYTEQDLSLGMDKVYVERDDQGFASYGGIQEIVIERENLTMSLDEEAARKLGGVERIEISFEVDDQKFNNLVDMLNRIFDSTELR